MNADLIIRNGMVLTLDDQLSLFNKADIAIQGSKIAEIAPQLKTSGKKEIDAFGKLVMPGLINTHTHAAMVMMRGLADDMPLSIWWKNFIFPIEKKLVNPEFVEIGVSLAALEMIKSGTTAFSDMYYFEEIAAEVCKKIGIRAFLGEGIIDMETPDAKDPAATFTRLGKMFEHYQNDTLISLTIAPHATYSCGEENLKKAKALADKLRLPLHIHLSETQAEVDDFQKRFNLSPVEYLEKIGFLGPNVMAVHCVALSSNDIQLLKKYDVKVVHCQESNMKLASGVAPVVDLMEQGITVGLGTDGAASNNNLDMFDEMDSVAKFHKVVRKDPTAMNARDVVAMATRNGGKVLQREDLGVIAPGKTADIIILELNQPHLVPLYNIYSQLVYSAGGSDVESVIINGRLIMENRKVLTANETEIIARAQKLALKIKAEVIHE